MSFGVTDAVGLTLHTALNGLSARQNVIADNIANVDTPGFRATSVEFESALKQAIAGGDFDPAVAEVGLAKTPTQTPVGMNGNNVDLRKETMAALQTQFSQQILGRAVSDKFSLLKIATGGTP